MRSKATDKRQKKGLAAIILDSYQEYCTLGYPQDPKVYVIQANDSTLLKVMDILNNGIIPGGKAEKNWGFQTYRNSFLKDGEIIFGPEQINIKWDGK